MEDPGNMDRKQTSAEKRKRGAGVGGFLLIFWDKVVRVEGIDMGCVGSDMMSSPRGGLGTSGTRGQRKAVTIYQYNLQYTEW